MVAVYEEVTEFRMDRNPGQGPGAVATRWESVLRREKAGLSHK